VGVISTLGVAECLPIAVQISMSSSLEQLLALQSVTRILLHGDLVGNPRCI